MKSLILNTLVFLYLSNSFTHCSYVELVALRNFDVAARHQVTKRQTNGEMTTLTAQDIAYCKSIASEYYCSSGLAQRLIDVYLSCGDDDSARYTANDCARSESGDLCETAFEQFDVHGVEQLMNCSEAVASNVCPSTCRTHLEDFQRRLGCCINSYINGSYIYRRYSYAPYVDYHLWDLCDVPLPATDCGNRLTLNIPASAQNCTSEDFFNQIYLEYICLPSVGQQYINTILKDRCSSYQQSYTSAEYVVNSCSINTDGVSCGLHAWDIDILYSLNSMCVSSNISCNTTCRSGINEVKKAVGCCINIYNISSSGDQDPSLSYSVWKSCGVESPGFCKSPLSLMSSGATSTMLERAVTWMGITILWLLSLC